MRVLIHSVPGWHQETVGAVLWLACQLPALTPCLPPPACVNVKRCGGQTAQETRPLFPLPAPLVGDQTALEIRCKFQPQSLYQQ